MNQFVAPTSFMTDTSLRRAKIAIRIVLRIKTVAENNSTSANARTHDLQDAYRSIHLANLLLRRRHRIHTGLVDERRHHRQRVRRHRRAYN